MFPFTITQYVQIGVCVVALFFSAYLGYSYEHNKFVAFKQEVQTTAKLQEEKVKSIRAQQELVTKGIEDEYNAKLSAVRNYYKSTSVWNNGSGSKVSGLSAAPSATDVITAYNLFAGQCAETTAQTIALQDWIKQQVGIK